MSYNYPYAPAPSGDPTAATGKRVLAWIIDGIIYVVLVNVITFATGWAAKIETHDLVGSSQTAEQFCTKWKLTHSGTCLPSDTSAITIVNMERYFIIFAILFVVYCLVQGLLGGSLGKLSMGLRVVKTDGSKAGIGASFIRTILWIIDAITFGIPIVGLILILTTKGHRRVGDMAASTYVVEQRYLDQPVILPGDPGYGYAGQTGMPGPFGQQGQYPPAGPPMQPFGQPAAYGQQGPGQQPASSLSGPSTTYEADKPVWDQERDTYIQFDTERNAWLEFDQKSQQWKPIST